MGPPSLLPALVPIFIGVIAVLVVGGILFSIAKGLGEWSANNAQPVLTCAARIVARREEVSLHHHHHDDHRPHSSGSTSYYVTFEFDSGERRELLVGNSEYGLLVEGDRGTLTCQGTRYLGFRRDVVSTPA